ncbi:MAG: hypothetical protein IMF16_03685 [Proteobacteria bacterium]|nr:hypothetical protein [Pseudomonadota bacterium]
MPKKGSSTSRKRGSKVKAEVQEVTVPGAPNAGPLYLGTVAEGGSAAAVFKAQWDSLVRGIESDLLRIRATSTSNIKRCDKRALLSYARVAEEDIDRALSGIEVTMLYLGSIDDNLRFARDFHEAILIVHPAARKRSRSRKGSTLSGQTQ